MLSCALMLPLASPARAQDCGSVTTCVALAQKRIEFFHETSEQKIKAYIRKQFGDHKKSDFSATEGKEAQNHEEWMINTYFKGQIAPAIKKFARQVMAVGAMQGQAQGMFIDADQQMETQRLQQTMQVKAHQDYQPSEDFCWFGTNVRSLRASESQSLKNASALSAHSLSRQIGATGTPGATSTGADKQARWEQFTKTYCDVNDNNADPANPKNSGLALACGEGPTDKSRVNKDIDYTRLIDDARTLDVNFLDGGTPPDEQDVQAFIDNVFPPISRQANATDLSLRAIAAKRGVAQNSFNAIIGMKSAGPDDADNTREYLASIMKQLGTADGQVYAMIGDKPSYYTQLEILAKRIYQASGFYAGLYDTPDNVERKAVAMHAIELMLDRALYESQLRREMVLSVLLSTELKKRQQAVNGALGGG